MGLKDRLEDIAVTQVVRRIAADDVTADREGRRGDDAPAADGGRGQTLVLDDPATPDDTATPVDPATPDDTAATGSAAVPGGRADSPTEVPASGWKAIGRRTLKEVGNDGVPMMAAAVAFAGFLSLFPAIIAAMSVYSLVTDPATAAQQAAELTAGLPSGAASLLTEQIEGVASSGTTAAGIGLAVSLLGALWSASGGMGMLIKGVNTAYDETDDRGFARNKGLAILMALGAIVFLAIAITLAAVLPVVLGGLGTVGTIAAFVGRWVGLAALIVVALAVLYRYAPDRADARWRWLTPGAVVATVLWLLATAAFSFFVDNFGSYDETYGAAAGVVVLLLWLQITALIVLLGAELNAEAERQTVTDTTTGPNAPIGQRGATPADELPPPTA